jgi:hypothetical protein
MITNYEGSADPTPPTARHRHEGGPISVAAAVGGFLFGFDPAVVNWGVDAIQVAFHLSSFLTGFAVALTGEAPRTYRIRPRG